MKSFFQVKVMVGGEEFNTSGTMITDRGYLVIGFCMNKFHFDR